MSLAQSSLLWELVGIKLDQLKPIAKALPFNEEELEKVALARNLALEVKQNANASDLDYAKANMRALTFTGTFEMAYTHRVNTLSSIPTTKKKLPETSWPSKLKIV